MQRRLRWTLLLAIPVVLHSSSRLLSAEPGIVVNEIMYAPASPEPEWIELFNRGSEPANLKKWQVTDATASRHLLPATDIIVPAGGFLLLTKDSILLHDARGSLACPIINVSGFPSLNNSGDAIMLYDALGRLMDSLVYRPEWGGSEGGRSLERRDADAPSTEQHIWGTCAAPVGATPGLPNSIVRHEFDLSISALFVLAGTVDTMVAIIRNAGKRPAGGYALLFYDDANFDSLAVPGELFGRADPEGLLDPCDSLRVPFGLVLSPGLHHLIAVAEFPADERPEDNRAVCGAMRAWPPGTLLVNEIMADPLSGKSEYVELVNASDRTVDLKGWGIADLTGSAGEAVISAVSRLIYPGEFLVLAADSSLIGQFPALAAIDPRLIIVLHAGHLSLNNDGDAVVIHDALHVTVDSVMYSASWHNPDLPDATGRSLERISKAVPSVDPRNWGSCVDPSGGSPGLRNSISVGGVPKASKLSCAPNPFSPDGDGVDDVVIIHYNMPLQTSIINVKIYDIRGRLIRRLASNEPGGATGNLIWDGREGTGAIARIGIYVVLLEAINGSGARDSAKGVLVLARRL
jgi:hypothetical protein